MGWEERGGGSREREGERGRTDHHRHVDTSIALTRNQHFPPFVLRKQVEERNERVCVEVGGAFAYVV